MGRKLSYVLVVIAALSLAACGGSGSSSASSTKTTAEEVFPSDVVLSSPYASTTSAAAMVVGKTKAVGSYSTERATIESMLAGTKVSDCTFDLDIFNDVGNVSCYGPEVDYTNFPGASAGEKNGNLPAFDLGIWNETEGSAGEACAAAKINALVDGVANIVNSVLRVNASMACMMNVNGLSKPDVGDSLNLKSALTDVITQNAIDGITIDSATMSRLADSGSYPVYEYLTVATLTHEEDTVNMWVRIKHIPQDADNSTYSGKVSYLFSMPIDSSSMPECASAGRTTQVRAGTVIYEKTVSTSVTSVKYLFQNGLYCGFDSETLSDHVSDYMDSKYNIDPTVTWSDDGNKPYGWVHDYNYGLFSMNPEDETGSFAYAWQAGYFDGNTRVFNATLSAADDNSKGGCAYYGFGQDVADGENLGIIDGMICNWTGPGGMATHATQLTDNPVVQRQCMDFDTASGVYKSIPATSTDATRALRITYAPSDDCDYAGGTYTYTSGYGMTNDVPTATSAFSNNLVLKTSDDFTMPTAPSDVD